MLKEKVAPQSKSSRKVTPFIEKHQREYGLEIASRNPITNEVESVRCKFCVYFEKEGAHAVNRKRKATRHIKYFKPSFRVDNYKSHLNMHLTQWNEYRQLSDVDKKKYFDRAKQPFANAFSAHLQVQDRRELTYLIHSPIVDQIIADLMFDPNDSGPDIPKEMALALFKKNSNSSSSSSSTAIYSVKVADYHQFLLCQNYIACGASFRLATRLLDLTPMAKQPQHAAMGSNSRLPLNGKIVSYVRTVVAIALSSISDIMSNSWAYSISLDGCKHGTTSYLDIRLRVYCNGDVRNFHLMALPKFERHSGEYIFHIVCNLLDALDQHWRRKIIGVSTDGAASESDCHRDVAGRLQDIAVSGFYRVWCASHQLDLVVQNCVTRFFNDDFFGTLTWLIGYLRKQQSLIEEMQSRCPKVADTCWESLGHAIKWILRHRIRLQQYFEQKSPACSPRKEWWIYLTVIERVCHEINATFLNKQGLTPLISQQINDLGKLRINLVALVDARRTMEIDQENAFAVSKNGYIVHEIGAVNMIRNCGSFFETIYSELSDGDRKSCWREVAEFFLNIIDGISKIKCQNDISTSQNLPPVLPHQLIRLQSFEFNMILDEQSDRYLALKSPMDKQKIEEDHRELIRACQNDGSLMSILMSQTEQISFIDGWSVVAGRFNYLKEFSGDLATIYPKTTIEKQEFSVKSQDEDELCDFDVSQLCDLSLEGILHSKQFALLNKLSID